MAAGDKLHILVMSAGWQAALACIQSYGRKGHRVSILSSKIVHPNDASMFVKGRFSLDEQGDARARELMALIDREAIDLVVPISDPDALLVARAKQLFPDSTAFISPLPEAISIAISRNRTTELCRELGIDTPKTAFITHDTARAAVRTLGYPCFLKLTGTFSGLGVAEIRGEAELDAKLEKIPRDQEMQLQEKVQGDFAGITGFASEGRVLESFAFRCDYLHSRGGTPCYAQRIKDDRLTETLSKIASRLGWTGGIDLDLLQRKDGSFVLLEINPRFSGTTVFALKVGIDLPAYYIAARMGLDRCDRFKASWPEAERFVSLLEESRYLRGAGEAGRLYSERYRADDKWVDNAFWDDWRYSLVLFEQVRQALLAR
jgi:biotin carboxylase